MKRLEGKTAVVTGGASGIGAAIASLFAREGAKVCIADINEQTGRRTADAIAQQGGQSLFVQADAASKEDVIRYIDRTRQAFGNVHILVNNAAVIHQATVTDTTEEDWNRILNTNLTSCFLGSKYAAKAMIEQREGGAIVNISSIHATLSEPSCSAYTAAKGGVEAFTRTLAAELAAWRIRANILAPGATYTELTRPMYTKAVTEALYQRIPLKRIAEPEEIAAGALFLASDESGYATGTTLTVDGGYVMDGSLPNASYWSE